ncbi:Ig-like domain-containing protein [Allohahella sp. A8]|uniref:Ig-like domain-containing protein n=1 Tax=Allohahella sp. A8 TaxID=3141461 RepID=UPI003A81390E
MSVNTKGASSPFARWTSMLAASLLLIACGGESGGGGGDSGPPAVAGVVVKGPVSQATVTVYPVTAEGIGFPIGDPVRTDSEGRYSVRNVTNYAGPIFVEAVGGAYVDEATNADAELGVETPLQAYSVIENSVGRTAVNLTPITSFAASRITRDNVGSDRIAISNLNAQTGAAFGLAEIVKVVPTNVLKTKIAPGALSQEDRYGVLLAGISQVALSRDLGPTLQDVFSTFSTDLADGLLDSTDGVLDSALGQLGSSNPVLLETIPNSSLAAAASGTGSGPQVVEVGRIDLTRDSSQLAVGEQRTLFATVYPRTIADTTVNWTSAFPQIVSVDQNGVVTAVAPGASTVTATSASNEAITGSVSVTVRNDDGVVPPPLTSLALTVPDTIEKGSQVVAVASPIPETAPIGNLQWSVVAGEQFVTVRPDGTIVGNEPGDAIIAATTTSVTGAVIRQTDGIKVLAPRLTGIGFMQDGPVNLIRSNSVTLGLQLFPDSAVAGAPTWSTDNAAVATVEPSGRVTGIQVGQATITATVGEFSISKIVNVIPPSVSALAINGADQLTVGASAQYTAVASPAGANVGTLSWSTDRPDLVTVDANGVLVAIAPGQANIRVQSSTNASVSGVKAVTIIQPAPPPPPPPPALTGLSILGPSPAVIDVGGVVDYDVAPVPAGAELGPITWTSSNDAIATVDANGVVRGLLIGDVLISVFREGVPASSVTVVVQPPISAPDSGLDDDDDDDDEDEDDNEDDSEARNNGLFGDIINAFFGRN